MLGLQLFEAIGRRYVENLPDSSYRIKLISILQQHDYEGNLSMFSGFLGFYWCECFCYICFRTLVGMKLLYFLAFIAGKSNAKGFYKYDNCGMATPNAEIKKYLPKAGNTLYRSIESKVPLHLLAPHPHPLKKTREKKRIFFTRPSLTHGKCNFPCSKCKPII